MPSAKACAIHTFSSPISHCNEVRCKRSNSFVQCHLSLSILDLLLPSYHPILGIDHLRVQPPQTLDLLILDTLGLESAAHAGLEDLWISQCMLSSCS